MSLDPKQLEDFTDFCSKNTPADIYEKALKLEEDILGPYICYTFDTEGRKQEFLSDLITKGVIVNG